MAEPEAKPEPKEVEEIAEPPLIYKVVSISATLFCKSITHPFFNLSLYGFSVDDSVIFSFLFHQTWILKVSIHCEACKRKVKRVLKDVEG